MWCAKKLWVDYQNSFNWNFMAALWLQVMNPEHTTSQKKNRISIWADGTGTFLRAKALFLSFFNSLSLNLSFPPPSIIDESWKNKLLKLLCRLWRWLQWEQNTDRIHASRSQKKRSRSWFKGCKCIPVSDMYTEQQSSSHRRWQKRGWRRRNIMLFPNHNCNLCASFWVGKYSATIAPAACHQWLNAWHIWEKQPLLQNGGIIESYHNTQRAFSCISSRVQHHHRYNIPKNGCKGGSATWSGHLAEKDKQQILG